MADYIFDGGTVVTMDPKDSIIRNGAVAVAGNRIVAIGPSAEVRQQHVTGRIIDCTGRVIMPGFVNAHNHTFDMLSRYLEITSEGLDSTDFGALLTQFWWPKVEDTCRREDVYYGAMLSCTEMLQWGITCTADMVEGEGCIPGALDEVARAFLETGMRGVISYEATERNGARVGELGLRENAEFSRKWNVVPDSRIRGRIGVHTAFSSSPAFLRRVRETANELSVGIQIHIAQSTYEVDFIRQHFGVQGSVRYLDSLGFLGPDVVAGHCIYIDNDEIDILARNGVKISFNIKSNGMGGTGVAPIIEFVDKGLTVALGLDGTNILDMFEMMVHAAYALRLKYLSLFVMPAQEVLRMATINGARALLMDDEIGSLEVGKKADIITIDLRNKVHLTPMDNLWEALAFGVRGRDVDTVMVDGRVVVEGGQILTVHVPKMLQDVQHTADEWKRRIEATPVAKAWRLPTI